MLLHPVNKGNKNSSSNDIQLKIIKLPVDTGRKLNVQKTFRRRPERLMNVL